MNQAIGPSGMNSRMISTQITLGRARISSSSRARQSINA
jgi:hypothetical protein